MTCKIRTVIGAALAAFAAALTVVSCGGGGGGFAGIDRIGVFSGEVTAFGSVFVNGVEWDTSGATITVDGAAGTQSDLRLGQIVTIHGTLHPDGTQGDADTVEFESAVEGPIASIDTVANTFVVLGQIVLVSVDTEFDDDIDVGFDGERTLEDLNVDDIVEVSGYRDSAGVVHATRIEIPDAASTIEVRGVVSNLDAPGQLFEIVSGNSTLTVDYFGAVLVDFGNHVLADGDFVEVRGTFTDVLTADTLQLEAPPTGGDGDASEVEGYITRFASASDFDVAGVTVTTDGATEFEGGTSADLALDVKVEVEGTVNAEGVVVADKVDIRVQPEETDVVLIGDVSAVNTTAGTLSLAGLDVLVKVSGVTRYKDESNAQLATFSLSDVHIGDHVEIRGAEDLGTAAANDAVATRVKRENPDDLVVLQGPVQGTSEPNLEVTILGVTASATLGTHFLGPDGLELDPNPATAAAMFFAQADMPGAVVAASVAGLGLEFLADALQIKETDD